MLAHLLVRSLGFSLFSCVFSLSIVVFFLLSFARVHLSKIDQPQHMKTESRIPPRRSSRLESGAKNRCVLKFKRGARQHACTPVSRTWLSAGYRTEGKKEEKGGEETGKEEKRGEE